MSSPVQAVERAFRILECFASSSGPLTIDYVAQETDLPRATTYRLVHTLESGGYLLLDGKSFRLGKQVLGLGFARLSRQGLAHSSQVVLDQLSAETGQTVVLVGRTSSELVVNEVIISAVAKTSGALSVAIDTGQLLKASDTVLAMPLELASGDLTIHVGQQIHVGQHGAGSAVQAIAVPVLGQDDRSIASLAIVIPVGRMTDAKLLETYGGTLRRAAEQLGY